MKQIRQLTRLEPFIPRWGWSFVRYYFVYDHPGD
jgi:hypothetical protein